MYNIALLGDERLLTFYRPAGFVIFSPQDEREVRSTLRRLQQENYAIVFVTEAVYQMAEAVIEEYSRSFLPAITILPGYGEHAGLGMRRLNGLVENGVREPEPAPSERRDAFDTGQTD